MWLGSPSEVWYANAVWLREYILERKHLNFSSLCSLSVLLANNKKKSKKQTNKRKENNFLKKKHKMTGVKESQKQSSRSGKFCEKVCLWHVENNTINNNNYNNNNWAMTKEKLIKEHKPLSVLDENSCEPTQESKLKLICRGLRQIPPEGGRVGGGGVCVRKQNRGDYIHRSLSRHRCSWVCRPCRCGFAGCGPRCAKWWDSRGPGTAGCQTSFDRLSCVWSLIWNSRAHHFTLTWVQSGRNKLVHSISLIILVYLICCFTNIEFCLLFQFTLHFAYFYTQKEASHK